jgi:hypothetical protein
MRTDGVVGPLQSEPRLFESRAKRGRWLKDASIGRTVLTGSQVSQPADQARCGGQGRDRTADLAVFSRVRLVRLRPPAFVQVTSSLISRGAGGLVIHSDAGSYGPVQISWAERRQNRACPRSGRRWTPPVGAEGFEPSLLRCPRSRSCMPCDLGFSYPEGDRSCPPRTSGSCCGADRARTSATTPWWPLVLRRQGPDRDQATPCLQSQIGQSRHLVRRRTAQVMAAVRLSVGVRLQPLASVVNGTVVARPARTTVAGPRSVGMRPAAG